MWLLWLCGSLTFSGEPGRFIAATDAETQEIPALQFVVSCTDVLSPTCNM